VKDFAAALDGAEAILKFNGLGHTCGIYSNDDARTREFALRMPSMRVLCNTPTPQGSVGITTNLQPAMTLGCGAIAGNITGDNIGPKHLINIKRLAYVARAAEDAFEVAIDVLARDQSPKLTAAAAASATASAKPGVSAAVERFLAQKGLSEAFRNTAGGNTEPRRAPANSAAVVDRFLDARRGRVQAEAASCSICPTPLQPEPAASAPVATAAAMQPPVAIVDFVGEQEVRAALKKSEKIYIGPKTIVTPLARDLAAPHDLLVIAQRT
jgi:acetaldehyde dehydrogenase (acetylating)